MLYHIGNTFRDMVFKTSVNANLINEMKLVYLTYSNEFGAHRGFDLSRFWYSIFTTSLKLAATFLNTKKIQILHC